MDGDTAAMLSMGEMRTTLPMCRQDLPSPPPSPLKEVVVVGFTDIRLTIPIKASSTATAPRIPALRTDLTGQGP